MKHMMQLAEMNKYMANRGMIRQMNEMGKEMIGKEAYMHNAGIKTKSTLEAIGHELKVNPPRVLAKTRKKFGKKRAQKQKVAILLSKARQAGAKIPQK